MGLSAPLNVVTTATRHMLDANITFGLSSDRFNARDKYRRSYTAEQRLGAGLGTAFGTALPALGLVHWLRKGAPAGIAPKTLPGTVASKAVGAVALGAAAAAGAWKTAQIVQDDGHFGAVGAAGGIVAGAAGGIVAGRMLNLGKFAPLLSGAAMIGGGIAGYYVGKHQFQFAERNTTEHKQAKNDDSHTIPFTDVKVDGIAGRAVSYARGVTTNFNEIGPTSQGMSFGYVWGMRDTYRTKYSNAERAGAMTGDLLAAGILGGGAIAVGAGLLKLSPYAQAGATGLKSARDQAANHLGRGVGTQWVNKLAEISTARTAAVGAAAGLLSGVVALKEWDRARDQGASRGEAAVWAGGTVAATAGLALGLSRAHAFSKQAPSAKAASSMLVAAALIGVLSSARLPVQQFINDARDAHQLDGKPVDWKVAGPTMAVSGAALGVGGYRLMDKLVPAGGIWKIPKWALLGAGAAVGAAAGGGAAWGLSATQPGIGAVGASAGAGAVLGGVAGKFLPGARQYGPLVGAVAGALAGIAVAPLLKQPAAAPAPTTPQDVAVTAGRPKYGRT